MIHKNKALISYLASKYSFTIDLIPLRAALFHLCFEMMKDLQRDKPAYHLVNLLAVSAVFGVSLRVNQQFGLQPEERKSKQEAV